MKALRAAGLILTVTPGRSGTKLLTRLLAECLDIQAEHEAAPRLNFVLRTVQFAPIAARWWLVSEKIPAIASRLEGKRPYADISHLYCKGFIEPLLDLGLRPSVILLTRPAREVALSMLAIGSVPARTVSGHLVLVGPDDPGVAAPADWRAWSDYQLCYWYAREIERRQRHYSETLPKAGCRTFEIAMDELTGMETFLPLARFLTRKRDVRIDPERFAAIVAVNQNPREGVGQTEAADPPDEACCAAAEADVDAALAALG
ncbi:hypothetical protein [Acuticoccus sediminis]|uniref:hypothetical protein n=1 Tax=Acuticoccus sediminis TaxID=2184697 RepID=UPI001CFD1101|nr:hypothetical protein [Acuticoccus sediminis]